MEAFCAPVFSKVEVKASNFAEKWIYQIFFKGISNSDFY